MSQESKDQGAICFTCGNKVRASSRWNRLADGGICPTCRDRMLDMVLPPLPRQGSDLPHELVHDEYLPEEPFDGPRRA